MSRHVKLIAIALSLTLFDCATEESRQPATGLIAFSGAHLFDGTGAPAIENAVVLVRNGRVEVAGPSDAVGLPEGTRTVDVSGKTIVPGLVVTHAHVGGTRGIETGADIYTESNILEQLGRYARYGVTTVVSLGDDQPIAAEIRDRQSVEDLDRARLFIAGDVIAASDPDEARRMVDENVSMGVDFIKIRVDDQLGTTEKMAPEVYRAVIERAHEHGLKVAAHIFYLEDAKALLRAGVDFIAHSVRDQEVDQELIDLFEQTGVCYCPTLTRDLSTFIYEDVPDYFEDPFFLREADPAVLDQLRDPERQQSVRESTSARAYKEALAVAETNLKKLADAGVTIAFGTDTGPPARFQGYFEHLELEMMVEAGLTPEQALTSATGDAARCLGLEDVGTLEPGKWADFLVLEKNPLTDIVSTRTLASVWIAGNPVPEKSAGGARDSAP